jgi:hypothetical protein
VPRNTELRVLYYGTGEGFDPDDNVICELDLRPMRLVPSVGEPIELTGAAFERPSQKTWVVAHPVEPLTADTAYALQVLKEEASGCVCDPQQWATVSSFTTGGDEDDTAPTFAGLERVEYREQRSGPILCGDDDFVPAHATFAAAIDTSTELRYNVYVDGELAIPYVDMTPGGLAFNVDCEGAGLLGGATLVRPGAEVEVRAIDLAGNESAANATTTIGLDVCDEFLIDPDLNDNGIPDSEDPPAPLLPDPILAAPPSPGVSDCALSRGPGQAPLALGALPLALAMLRRFGRRRRIAAGRVDI